MELAWSEWRERVMDEEHRCGRRCWAWWTFEACEPQPESEAAEGLRLFELGELGDEERASVRERARGALYGIEWANECEDAGAVVTGPDGAGTRMRARRDADAAMWRRVLEALDEP